MFSYWYADTPVSCRCGGRWRPYASAFALQRPFSPYGRPPGMLGLSLHPLPVRVASLRHAQHCPCLRPCRAASPNICWPVPTISGMPACRQAHCSPIFRYSPGAVLVGMKGWEWLDIDPDDGLTFRISPKSWWWRDSRVSGIWKCVRGHDGSLLIIVISINIVLIRCLIRYKKRMLNKSFWDTADGSADGYFGHIKYFFLYYLIFKYCI